MRIAKIEELQAKIDNYAEWLSPLDVRNFAEELGISISHNTIRSKFRNSLHKKPGYDPVLSILIIGGKRYATKTSVEQWLLKYRDKHFVKK